MHQESFEEPCDWFKVKWYVEGRLSLDEFHRHVKACPQCGLLKEELLKELLEGGVREAFEEEG